MTDVQRGDVRYTLTYDSATNVLDLNGAPTLADRPLLDSGPLIAQQVNTVLA